MNNELKRQLDALYEFFFGGTVKASEAVGATDEQIGELLRHVGKPLPESYIQFLRHYDNMADVMWNARQVIRSNFVGTPEQLETQRELYQGQLQIGGEGESWNYTLDINAQSPQQMKVTEWNMLEGKIQREWQNFDAFLDYLIQSMNQA
jgi:hypothetical protein